MRAFLIGVGAGYGIAIPVGAISVLIVETAIRGGWGRAFAAGAGAATADFVYSAAAIIGGAGLASVVESIDTQFRVASAIVLAGIAVLGLRRAHRRSSDIVVELAPGPSTYRKFVGLTLINPQTIVYFAAFVVGLGVVADMSLADGLLFVAGAGLASLSWQTVIATVGSLAGLRLSAGAQLAAIVSGNVIVLVFAVLILLR